MARGQKKLRALKFRIQKNEPLLFFFLFCRGAFLRARRSAVTGVNFVDAEAMLAKVRAAPTPLASEKKVWRRDLCAAESLSG